MIVRNLILVIAALAAATLSFVIGDSVGQRAMLRQAHVQVEDIQAMLLVDRLGQERKIKSLLLRGCPKEALAAIDINENSDLKLLASYASRDHLDQSTVDYINNQDANLLRELKSFNNKYGDKWPVVECNS
jgi:hypothetical protein